MNDRIKSLKQITEAVKLENSVAIYPHVGVDGDCLGSALALMQTFQNAGIHAHIISEGPIPDRFDFMPGIKEIIIYDKNKSIADEISPEKFLKNIFYGKIPDIGILVDCTMPERSGSCAELYSLSKHQAVIDHHFTVSCPVSLCCLDASACATGELIYDLIKVMEDTFEISLFSQNIAANIYTAIFSDTGGFSYSNTTSSTFKIAGRLFEKFEINTRQTAYHLYEKTSIAKIRLEGMAYSSTYFHYDNKVAICLISKKMIEECGAVDNDVDGICSQLKNIEGIIVSFVLREKAEGEIRGNIRSSEGFDAAKFAVSQGGGGHVRAAGFNLSNLTLQQSYEKVLKECKLYLKK